MMNVAKMEEYCLYIYKQYTKMASPYRSPYYTVPTPNTQSPTGIPTVPYPTIGSPEDVALNQAILESLRTTTTQRQVEQGGTTPNVPPLPQPVWNNGTQFVPVQTTTTYIPVAQTGQVRSPTIIPNVPTPQTGTVRPTLIPTIPVPTQVRSPTVPVISTNTLGQTQTIRVPAVSPTRLPTVPPLTGQIQVDPAAQVRTTQNRVLIPPLAQPTVLPPQFKTITQPTIPRPLVPPGTQITNTRPLIPTGTQTTGTRPLLPPGTQTTGTRPLLPPGTQPITTIPRPPITQPITQTITRPTTVTGFQQIPRPTVGTEFQQVPPLSPRTTFAPLQTVNLSPRGPRSPGRMTEAEEDQMRIAIMASLQDIPIPTSPRRLTNPPIVATPPRSPMQSPIMTEENEIEDVLFQEAIKASIEAAEQARLATFHANQIATLISPPVSPRTFKIQEDRLIREQQEEEYQEALRIDRERDENARLAAEAAAKAAIASEEATKILQAAKIAEDAKREALQPPSLKFPIEAGDAVDVFTIRFRLPGGAALTHSFNKNEPLESVIQQLRFDTKHIGDFTLTIPPRTVINCSKETPINQCGIENRILILVTQA